jgi:hypothetical protein
MKKVAFIFLALFSGWQLTAQSDFMLYDFGGIGQSLHVNPASPQQSKVWIGLPALSGVNFSYQNNGFSAADILEKGTDINANLARVANSLDDNSGISTVLNVDLLGIGFKAGNGFWSTGANYQLDYRMSLPSSLMQVLFGNNNNVTLTNFAINDFQLETTSRLNLYLGYQHKFLDERLIIGGRFKYIFGQANIKTDRVNFEIRNTDKYTTTITADALIRTSGENTIQDSIDEINISDLILSNNTGIGLDFGVYFKLNEHWSFSASVLDLGFITWRDDVKEYRSEGTFEYDGINVDLSEENPGSGFENFTDSLIDAFNFTDTTGGSYRQSLNSRFFASVTYNLNKRHSLSAIYQGQNWGNTLIHNYGVNYLVKVGRGFHFKAGYSIINGANNNVGLGVQFKAGPIQLYLMTENIIGAINYAEMQNTSLRLGLNLALFGKKKKQESNN